MSPIPGAADLEHKNAYWIDFGKREEQERILQIIKEHFSRGAIELVNSHTIDVLTKKIKGEN